MTLTKVSEKYFSILEDYFKPLKEYTEKKGLPVSQCICDVYSALAITGILFTLSEELKRLDWSYQKNKIVNMHGVKTSYLGGAYLYHSYPESTVNFLKKTALYSDTLVINDPILSELLAWEKRKTGELSTFNLVAQYAVRLLTMEKMFCSDIDPPICFLAPCSVLCLGNQVYGPTDEFIHEAIIPKYAGSIFDRNFISSQEVVEYLEKFGSFEEFSSTVKKSNVPFVNPDGSPVTKTDFLKVYDYYDDKYEDHFDLATALFLLLRGRFSAPAYDLSVSGSYASCFATDFKGVWRNFVWLLNHDNGEIAKQSRKKPLSRDTLVLQTLQNPNLSWLGNVPIEKIIEMRERGELQDMRDFLSRSVEEIQSVSDEEFLEVASEAEYKMQQTFLKHSHDVKSLSDTFKRKYKIQIVSIIVTGSLGIVSAMYPPIAQTVGILSSTAVESVSIGKLISQYLDEREALRTLKRKPVGILFETRQTPLPNKP
jgi:hypothetical protein